MNERFDSLSRAMAGSMPRRGVLRFVGATVAAGAAAVVVRPFRADACVVVACPPEQSCGTICCDGGKVCGNPTTGTCVCPAGSQACGNGQVCCPKGYTCSDPAGFCCCPAGATPCGSKCCAKGVACLDRANSICGCQPRTTPCGNAANLTCCPAGAACSPGCQAPSGNTVLGFCFLSDRALKANV